MRGFTLTVLIIALLLSFCNHDIKTGRSDSYSSDYDSSGLNSNKEKIAINDDDDDFSQNPECVKYIRKYKDWIVRCIKVREETKKNPNDSIALINFKNLELEGKNLGEPTEICAGNRSFQDSLQKITEFAAKELND
jgi:hypothetical protein